MKKSPERIWKNRIVRQGEKPARSSAGEEVKMSDFICEKCDMKIAEFENGELIIFCCSDIADRAKHIPFERILADRAKHIPFERILAAAVLEDESLQILLKFCLENPRVKFL